MSTTNRKLEQAEPGDEIETERRPATVLATADSKEELVDQIELLIEEGR